ncbi:(Fe-S)-binding protein [Chloroflexota bacterium]
MLGIEEYKRQATKCVRCSFCKYIDMNWIKSMRFARQCPINTRYGFDLYSAHGLLYAALAELDGQLEFTPKFVDALYHCTLCGACDSRCKRNLDIEVLQVIETLRSRYVEQGNNLLPEHKTMADNILKTRNEYGEPHEDRFKWLPDKSKPAQKADVVYFVGCNSAYRQPELAAATVKLFDLTGTQFMLLADEWCSGNYVLATGQIDLARELAEHNVKAIQDSGAKTVITSSAECYKSIKVDFPKLLGKSTEDMPYVVLHITEYINQLIEDGKLQFKKSLPMKVTYHDPCNLGRLSEPWQEWEPKYDGPIPVGKNWRRGDKGIYDPPRNVLKGIPGLELVEMERNRSNAWSVGNCGGVALAFPDFAMWTAGELIEEARATGAEAIVTCSPDEKELLAKAANEKNIRIAVYDITEIILQAM